MSISPMWLVILPAPLNGGKIKFLFTLEKAIPQRKTFCVFECAKIKVPSRCSALSEQNSALIRPIVRAFDGKSDSSKRVNACAKEKVLEDHMF